MVDDEPLVLESLAMLLEDEHDIETAGSASEARQILENSDVDVVVSDQRMPGERGTELLTWVRQTRADTYRILLTGFSDADAMAAAINDAAVWHFLRKPWDNHEVRTLLRRAVEARREAGRWRIAFEGREGSGVCEADFVIDATGRAAQLACAQGATRELFDQLVGVVVTLEAAAGRSSSMSLVESVPQGWWYSAPLANGGLTVAYLSDADLIDTQRICDEAGWFDALDAAAQTRSRLAPWLVARDRPPLHPKVVHAGSACTSKMAGPDWLAVGDAAASFDPLSSQGIGWAMTTAYHGALAASKHLDGDPVSLDNYEGLARNLFADYQQQLAEHYAVERRWPDATFWSRRRSPGASALHVGR